MHNEKGGPGPPLHLFATSDYYFTLGLQLHSRPVPLENAARGAASSRTILRPLENGAEGAKKLEYYEFVQKWVLYCRGLLLVSCVFVK